MAVRNVIGPAVKPDGVTAWTGLEIRFHSRPSDYNAQSVLPSPIKKIRTDGTGAFSVPLEIGGEYVVTYEGYSESYYSGQFSPETRYTITIPDGTTDISLQTLKGQTLARSTQYVGRDSLAADVAAAVPIDQEVKRTLALRRWFTALAGRDTSPADILSITDSIFEGHRLSAMNNRPMGRLLNLLRGRFPVAGVTGGLGYVAVTQGSGQVADYPVVNTGGAGGAAVGLGNRCRILTASGHKSVFSFSGATSVGLRYLRVGSAGAVGTFTWKVDAGSATTVDVKTGTVLDFVEVPITIPDTGAHTITVEWASGTVNIEGFVHYSGDETKGIRMWEGGHGGDPAYNWVNPGAAGTNLQSQVAAIQPDLVLIELGANDRKMNAKTSAQFAASMTTILAKVRAGTTIAPSIVIVPVWDISVQDGTTVIEPWSNFVDVMYGFASADPDICIWDLQQRVKPVIGVNDTAKGLLRSDEGVTTVHPSDAGAAFIADGLFTFLTPR